MERIDAFGMPTMTLIEHIEAVAGTGEREIVVTTDSKTVLEDLVRFSNNSDSALEINEIDNGWEVRIEIGEVGSVKLPHSDKSSVPEDAV